MGRALRNGHAIAHSSHQLRLPGTAVTGVVLGSRESTDAIDLLNRNAAMSLTIDDYNQRRTRAQ